LLLLICICIRQKTSSDPADTHYGWAFGNAEHSGVTPATGVGSIKVDGADPDTLEGFKTVRDIYEAVDDTNGTKFMYTLARRLAVFVHECLQSEARF
jgi:hypothetical protein